MRHDLTPAVARALALAAGRAGSDDPDAIHAGHLLAGLLADDEGRAADLVRGTGGDPTILAGSAMTLTESPFTARQALDAAGRDTRQADGAEAVGSEAVLLALLRGEPGLASALAFAGGSLAALEEAVRRDDAPLELPEPLDLAPITDHLDAARVVDASANRAREALRVVEDHCRFVLGDAGLSRAAKEIRHGLAAALETVPPELLIASRDTLADVGTSITTDREATRHTLGDVLRANLKRLQESLRSLEEFGKRLSPDLGAAVESLRYRAYTLERAVLIGGDARSRLEGVRLCVLVSGAGCAAGLEWTIAEAAAGGAGMIQLREKTLSDRDLLARARDVRRWTRAAGVLFVVNDRPDIAALAEADGVHLGQDDLPVREARRIVGGGMLVGVSTHAPEQIRRAVAEGASYLGVGPVFTSTTKDFSDLAGTRFVAEAAAETALPWFAIGGITPANIGTVAAAGGRRVAVGAAVARADDPRSAAATLHAALG